MRWRYVGLAVVAVLLGVVFLTRNQLWTSYHNAAGGWSMDVPATARRLVLGKDGMSFRRGDLRFDVADTGRSSAADTQLPLDPVDFLPARPPLTRAMTVVSAHRRFRISARYTHSSSESTAFRMLRSLRFD